MIQFYSGKGPLNLFTVPTADMSERRGLFGAETEANIVGCSVVGRDCLSTRALKRQLGATGVGRNPCCGSF